MKPDARVEERLTALRAAGRYRDPQRAAADALEPEGGGLLVDARSNDYLGLSRELAAGVAVPGSTALERRSRDAGGHAAVSRETARALDTPKADGDDGAGPTGRGARGMEGMGRSYSGAASPGGGPASVLDTPREAVSRETDVGTRVGAGAARLISGTTPEHLDLERQLATWLGAEACLLFSSAYAANLGAIAALALPGDIVFSDALNHASIIDGCRLSRAQVIVVRHRDLDALATALAAPAGATAAKWVVSESYFGMEGTSPDLAGLRSLCNRHGAGLILDEAHSLGAFGPDGRGLAAAAGVHPDVLIGGFGKAFGLQGGFAATSLVLHRWLWNRARSFVFSTALSPWLSQRALQHLHRIQACEPERRRLAAHSQRLQVELAEAGVPLPEGRHGPVFPIVLGSEQAALDAAAALRPLGVLAHAVRPPTVPPGTARIRVTLRSDMTEQDVGRLGSSLVRVWNQYGAGSPQPSEYSPAPTPGGATATASEHDANTSPEPSASRWIVLGTGTGIGKSFIADALVRAIGARGCPVAGLKPIETGCKTTPNGEPLDGDAARLEAASFRVRHPRPHPLYGFREALAPSLAARHQGESIDLAALAPWLDRVRSTQRGQVPSLVVETAGGVFSPLAEDLTNFDLALCLGVASWVLVAPDRLGVLHELGSTLRAMKSLGRTPNWIVLSAPSQPDPSTGTNAAELRRCGVTTPVVEVARNEPFALQALLPALVG